MEINWEDLFNTKRPIDRKYVRASNSRDSLRWPYKGGYKGPPVYASYVPEDEQSRWNRLPTIKPVLYADAKVSNKPAKRGRTEITASQVLMGKIKEGQVTVKFGTPSRFYRFGKRIHHNTAFGLYRKGVRFTVL